MEILLGSDPELFVKKGEHFISGHGLIEGDKQNPFLVECGAVQVDGMALEYNTDPTSSLAEWQLHHSIVQKQMKDMLDEDMSLHAVPTVFFSEEVFNTSPEEALILGCEPDYNAYTGLENPKPNEDSLFRTGAGHIHIGWTEGENINDPFHIGECCEVVKQLDRYLGLNSLRWDTDTQRRSMYGKAGAYRPKSYGVEYRVLSNAWVMDEKIREFVFNTTILALNNLMKPTNPQFKSRHEINDSDVSEANWLLDIHDIPKYYS